ncbi:MAG TPA: hypothetical protein EYP49_09480 [Anaerolineae bacterium]|nr:hypothetical protein [Anaerolineae bacterium]
MTNKPVETKEASLAVRIVDPLDVRMVGKEKPPPLSSTERLRQLISALWHKDRPLFWLLAGTALAFTLVCAITLYAWLRYIHPQFSDQPKAGPRGLWYSVEYPRYWSAGDEESFTVTLANYSIQPITDTVLTLVFTNTVPINTPIEGSNIAVIGELGVGEQKTRAIKIRLQRSTMGQIVPSELRVQSAQFNEQYLDSYDFSVAYIWRLKSLIKQLGSTLLSVLGGVSTLLIVVARQVTRDMLPLE